MDRNSFEIPCSCIVELDRGGGRQGEKGAGGVRQAGEDGARSGIPKLAGSGRKNAKRREPTSTGREPGLKGTESGSFKPPCPSPPPCFGRGEKTICCPIGHYLYNPSGINGTNYVTKYCCVLEFVPYLHQTD